MRVVTVPGESHQPRTYIVTVYGLYARDLGGWLSIAHLIGLLAELGVDEPAVRSSISRLKRRQILIPERRNGLAGYALSSAAKEMLADGDRRIFRRSRFSLADGWVLAIFSIPESERSRRHALRAQLGRLGYGTVAAGVWVAPAHVAEETRHALGRLGLTEYVDLFAADYLGFADLGREVGAWWDLAALQKRYANFVAHHEPVLQRWRSRAADECTAFADHVRTVTAWRELSYLDPGLPTDVLPAEWDGSAAAEIFFAIHDLLARAAQRHVQATTPR